METRPGTVNGLCSGLVNGIGQPLPAEMGLSRHVLDPLGVMDNGTLYRTFEGLLSIVNTMVRVGACSQPLYGSCQEHRFQGTDTWPGSGLDNYLGALRASVIQPPSLLLRQQTLEPS